MAIKQGGGVGRPPLVSNNLRQKGGSSKEAEKKGGQARTPPCPRRSSLETLPPPPPLPVKQSFPRNLAISVMRTSRRTQLNVPVYEVLMAIKNAPNLMRRPNQIPPNQSRRRDKFYEFHQDFGHTTE